MIHIFQAQSRNRFQRQRKGDSNPKTWGESKSVGEITRRRSFSSLKAGGTVWKPPALANGRVTRSHSIAGCTSLSAYKENRPTTSKRRCKSTDSGSGYPMSEDMVDSKSNSPKNNNSILTANSPPLTEQSLLSSSMVKNSPPILEESVLNGVSNLSLANEFLAGSSPLILEDNMSSISIASGVLANSIEEDESVVVDDQTQEVDIDESVWIDDQTQEVDIDESVWIDDQTQEMDIDKSVLIDDQIQPEVDVECHV